MREYETLGHMTFKCNLMDDHSVHTKSYFLPHSAVIRDDSLTTKCRVVFDASAKSSSNVSLNDLLLAGPTIQEELFSILLRVRLRPVVLSADVKMMYRCIQIHEDERDYQQILWRWNTSEPIKVYKLNTVTYGTSSAPFQATRCLLELANLSKSSNSRTSNIIEKAFYMDDLLVSLETEESALEVYKQLSDILVQANFKLRKWASNNSTVLNKILELENNQGDDKSVLLHDKKLLKPLGIIWDPVEDNLQFSVNINFNPSHVTKRTILSAISQIFDPLGLIGPAIIRAKLIIQQLWKLKLDWDDHIPGDLKSDWLEFISQIGCLNNIKINRHVLSIKPTSIELFGFSDSSEKAYGACVYIASLDEFGKKHIKLLTAKSKVAPVKQQTLPRLELLGALLLAKLMYRLKHILDVDIANCTYFTDSTIVLCWLKRDPCVLKTFVANRVARISELSNLGSWRFVNGKNNPADIISRGLSPRELVSNSLWFEGPEFLKSDKILEFDNNNFLEVLPELKLKSIAMNTVNVNDINNIIKFDIFTRYSDLAKLRRVFAWILRFIKITRHKIKYHSLVLSADELKESLLFMLKLAQLETFGSEILMLKKGGKIRNNSKVLNLNPFLDTSGLLRVGGRLNNANLNYDQQHPIILPYKHELTRLIVRDAHSKHLHSGVQNLLSIIRLKYWPIRGKNMIKEVVKSCVTCCRSNPKPVGFLMGSLPRSRITPCRPFYNCGVDYAGPILVREGTLRRSKTIKTYICIFVCFATRAAHIELAKDLTTQSFLNCLKRFCVRRGKPAHIHSDNGLNFVGANNYILELYSLLNQKEHNNIVTSFLAEDQIKWHFIPARSPHMGGLWEAAVKSAKYHLRRVLGDSCLTYEELYTLLVKIEACLNSRPLTSMSTDINDYLPLTPSHFLIGDSLLTLPDDNVRDAKT